MLLQNNGILPVQLFVAGRNAGPLQLDAAHFKPARNREGFNVKPEGGLWTSTEQPYGSGWIDWCLGNQPDWVDASFDDALVAEVARVRAFRLHVAPGARVYHIDTLEDLSALVRAFPYRDKLSDFRRAVGLGEEQYPDWEAARNVYDAIHLTEAGQWRTRSSHPHNLYGWDCESTLWLNWAFERVEDLGVVTYGPRSDEE